jgi:peptidoglycan/LPS O-acetylase OafA/YrhL
MEAQESRSPARSDHLPSLDGLRGVAALIVVLAHSLGAVAAGSELLELLSETPLIAFVNAKFSVQVFFVLSGFVLTGSLLRSPGLAEVSQFYVRRIFRIHPPYVFGVLFAWTASFFYAPVRNEMSQFSDTLFSVHLRWRETLGYLLFPGPAGLQMPVGWTLTIEMIFSLLMPVMLWVARRSHVGVLMGLCLIPFAIGPNGLPIIKFALDFALGIALFLGVTRWREWFGRIGVGGAWVWVAVTLTIGNLPLYLDWPWMIEGGSPGTVFVQGIGAAGLVCAAAYASPVARCLDGRISQFLGKISYSVYLLHWPIIGLLSGVPWPGSDLFLAPLVIAVTIPIATLAYRFVEVPSIRLSSRICRSMAKRLHQVALPARLESVGD